MFIVIASWPKSGNTWVRSLLACTALKRRVPLNELAKVIPIDVDTALWERVADLHPTNGKDCVKQRAKFFTKLKRAYEADDFTFLKTHSVNAKLEGVPTFDIEAIDRVIYVVRNPLDILPSFAEHMGVSLERAWELMRRDDLWLAGSSEQHPQYIASWETHVRSFLASRDLKSKRLLVRYEDLHSHPITTLMKICSFIDLTVDERTIAASVYWNTFEARQTEEKRENFAERASKTQKFFRRGAVGSYKDEVPAEIQGEMIGEYEAFCKQLGYDFSF